MYRILLPIESTEKQPTNAAKAIGNLPIPSDDVSVTILNVFEEFQASDDSGVVTSDELYDKADLPAAIPETKSFLEGKGIDVNVRREHGDPKEVIVEVAEELDTNMIAMGGRKQTRVGKVLFGSVTQAVLLNANQSVFVTMSE